jgi:hypothetical protein
MSTPKTEEFAAIDTTQLEAVAGGASKSDESLNVMLTQITSSIKDLANTQDKGTDPMQMMLMMMMFGGGGGGATVAAPVAGVAAAPVINVSAAVGGGGWCRRRGKKGW